MLSDISIIHVKVYIDLWSGLVDVRSLQHYAVSRAQSLDISNSMWSVLWALVITQQYYSTPLLHLHLNYFQFVTAFVPSQGALTAPQHKLTGNHLPGVKLSKPLAGVGASLSSINRERQVYAQDFPHISEESKGLMKVKFYLSSLYCLLFCLF